MTDGIEDREFAGSPTPWWPVRISYAPMLVEDSAGDTVCEGIGCWQDMKLLTAAPLLLKACQAALKAMTNQRYGKPRIGMESECEQVRAALEAAIGDD